MKGTSPETSVVVPIANHWQNVRDTAETSNAYSKQKQIIAATCATLGCFINGSSLGYTGAVIPSLTNGTYDVYGTPVNFSEEQISWITSLLYAGSLIGGLLSNLLMDFMGRRRAMLFVVSTFFTLGHVLIYFNSCVEMVYIGRFCIGIGLGLELRIASAYVSEISSRDMRPILGTLVQFMGTLGIVTSFTLGGHFFSWFGLIAANGVAIIPFIFGTFFIPESPHWLLSKGYEYEAEKSLEWLRGRDDAAIELEMLKIQKYVLPPILKARANGWKSIRDSPKPLLTSLTMMFFWMFSGYSLHILYSRSIFEMAGSSIESGSASIIVGLVLLISCLASTYTLVNWRRKWMMLASMFLLFIFNLLLGFSLFIHERAKGEEYRGSIQRHFFPLDPSSTNDTRGSYLTLNDTLGISLGWIPLLCVIGIIFFGSLGQASLIWIVSAEMTPTAARPAINSTLMFFAFLSGFLVNKTYVNFVGSFGESITFWIYSGMSVAGAFFILIFVPETKGKTKNEMRIYFGKGPRKNRTLRKVRESHDIPLQEIS